MRDPAAGIRFEGEQVIRDLKSELQVDHFLRSALARRWVDRGDLVHFSILDDRTVVARRLAFVSQPSEWSDAQLHTAAAFTLRLQVEAVQAGYDMKDASAWNILFDGCRPVFCDLLSFEALTTKRWWALGQFARHFIFPLLASKRRGLKSHAAHAIWRDGMPVDQARRLLGPSVFLTRYGMLFLGGERRAHSDSRDAIVAEGPTSSMQGAQDIGDFRRGVDASLHWMLNGLAKTPSRTISGGWSGYRDDRPHYGGESLDQKRAFVTRWLSQLAPAWVLDLGCNTGEFSQLAARTGACVVSADADHDSIATIFESCRDSTSIHPVVCDLDDLRGGRGWSGAEFPGLMARIGNRADLVFMLALIHHLVIGASVPLFAIARFAFEVTKDALLVELIDEADDQLRSLCGQRRRNPAEFTAQRQRKAFLDAGFYLAEEMMLDGANRSVAVFRKHVR